MTLHSPRADVGRLERISDDTIVAAGLRRGFTLVEMMVAMALTLLLMAALAKAFGTVGQEVRTSRAQVDLSSRMRDVTHRLRDELSRCTAKPNSPVDSDGDGYLVYFDGPVTDVTGALLGQSPTPDNENTLQDSVLGDFDDYLAFTAIAPETTPFTGKVPRFLLDVKTSEVQGVPYVPGNFPGSPLDPVVITSQHAEIVYFISPVYQTAPDQANPSQSIHIHDANGDPLIQDFTGNLMPDTMRLHRRVLLIRPDLNLDSTSALPTFTMGGYTYMQPDVWGTDTTTNAPAIKTPGTNGLTTIQTNRAWQIGMAPVHQQCDLSVRRLLNVTGAPTQAVAANSLEDLELPHNRFAHVRLPPAFVGLPVPGGTFGYTSMPLLALGRTPQVLQRAATLATPAAPPLGGTVTQTTGSRFVTPSSMNGFLRPEFILGHDLTHTDLFGDGWGIERVGEDVLLTGVLSFDVKIFDPVVQSYVLPGPDLRYGTAGVDDDGNGRVDDPLDPTGEIENNEAGFVGSDDRVVTPNDPAYVDALLKLSAGNLLAGEQPPAPGVQGSFVDLLFPFQAGGTIRGPIGVARDIHTGVVRPNMLGGMWPRTDFSGADYRVNPTRSVGVTPFGNIYTDELFGSGRVVTNASGVLTVYQPAFDTFTDLYERDGFLQAPLSTTTAGNLWWLRSAAGVQPAPLPGGALAVDAASNGIDDVLNNAGLGSQGTDVRDEMETSRPFKANGRAIKVTIRTEAPQVRQIEQSSVVTFFDE